MARPLPADAGNEASPPTVTCYTSNDGGAWIPMADGSYASDKVCGLVFSSGVWNVAIINGTPGWLYRVIVVY